MHKYIDFCGLCNSLDDMLWYSNGLICLGNQYSLKVLNIFSKFSIFSQNSLSFSRYAKFGILSKYQVFPKPILSASTIALSNASWRVNIAKIAPAKMLFIEVLHGRMSVITLDNSNFSMKITELLSKNMRGVCENILLYMYCNFGYAHSIRSSSIVSKLSFLNRFFQVQVLKLD